MDETSVQLRNALERLTYYKKKYEDEQELVRQLKEEVGSLTAIVQASDVELQEVKEKLVVTQQELQEKSGQTTPLKEENVPRLNVPVPASSSLPMTARSEFGGKASTASLRSEIENLKKELKKQRELLESPYGKSQVEGKLKGELRQLKKEMKKYDKPKELIQEKDNEIKEKESKINIQTKDIAGLTEKVNAVNQTLLQKNEKLTEVQGENQIFQSGMTKALKDVDSLATSNGEMKGELSQLETKAEKLKQELEQNEEEHTKRISEMGRQLKKATSLVHQVNQDAERYKCSLRGRDEEHKKQLKEPAEQECGLNAIYSVIHEQSREKIKQIKGLVPRVEELSKSEYEYVKAAAERTMMKIESDKVYPQAGRGLNITCDYFKQCQRFLDTLKITDMAWEPLYNMCYCSTCNAKRGLGLYFPRGEPPKDYGIPIGWCRFALKVSEAKVDTHNLWDNWHVAFHGTSKESINDIIKVGHLVVPGDTVIGGKRIGVRPFHIPESESTCKIFLSPTIRYAGMDTYASPSSDPTSGRSLEAKVAFQVRINPKSYGMRAETVGAESQIDPAYLNEELEWFTNQHGSTELYGVLVKLTVK